MSWPLAFFLSIALVSMATCQVLTQTPSFPRAEQIR